MKDISYCKQLIVKNMGNSSYKLWKIFAIGWEMYEHEV